MSKKKTQLDRAIEALEQKQADIKTRALLDQDALQQAINTLKAQQRVVRPKAVKAPAATTAATPRSA